MKLTRRVHFKTTDESWNAFALECATSGVEYSDVLRDLMAAAIPYMKTYGRWFPPDLEPARPKPLVTTDTAAPVPEPMGKGTHSRYQLSPTNRIAGLNEGKPARKTRAKDSSATHSG